MGASHDMQIVNDSAASQIKQIFAETSIAGTPSLLVSDMCQRMFNSNPFTQLGSTHRSELALAQFAQ
jgi:hypothetical protein